MIFLLGKIAPMSITLSSLIYYPIKACRGFEVESAQVERMGLQDDRRMMVVTPEGDLLTQREFSKLAWVLPTLNNGTLTLSAPDFDSVQFTIQKTHNPTGQHLAYQRRGSH